MATANDILIWLADVPPLLVNRGIPDAVKPGTVNQIIEKVYELCVVGVKGATPLLSVLVGTPDRTDVSGRVEWYDCPCRDQASQPRSTTGPP